MTILEKIKSLRKFNFDDLYNSFLGLEKKQQAAAVGGGMLLLLVLLWLPTQAFSSLLSEKENDYLQYKKDAQKLHEMITRYSSIQKALTQASSSQGDNLSGLVYGEAESVGIAKKKVSLKTLKLPSGNLFSQEGKSVEVKKIPYDQFMKFVYNIKNNKKYPIIIDKMVIKIDRLNRQVVNEATFSIATIKARAI